jgi:hypothetical protein
LTILRKIIFISVNVDGFTGGAFLQRFSLWTVFFIVDTEGKASEIA